MELAFGLCIIHILALISELTAQTYDGRSKGHKTFPSDIPANSTEIDLRDNDINSFPDDAFNDFEQLEWLDIGENPFTVMPDLAPVGDTLKVLEMRYCKLTELNASIVNELVVLEEIKLYHCKALTSFPDVPGPGNTLWEIYCDLCSVSTFPMLSHYKSLKYIDFVRNPMTSVSEAAVASLHLSGALHLWDTAITSLPDNPQAYENITTLWLQKTDIRTVPLTCPRADLTIDVRDTPVTMCECDNIWLKALDGRHGSVRMDSGDDKCGDATTIEELLQQQCQHPDAGVRTFTASVTQENFFCQFPVQTYTTDVSQCECVLLCINALGCSSIGYRKTDRMKGNCAIIAPTDTALSPNDIPDADHPDWNYITVE